MDNYDLKGNNIKVKKLSKKSKYAIPCIVADNKDSNYYKVIFHINYEHFKKEKEYYSDYRLMALVVNNVWNTILNNLINNLWYINN